MKRVFADTYYFIGLLNPDDSAHRRVIDYSEHNNPPLITTAWVMTELADGLAKTSNRQLFSKVLLDTEEEPSNLILPPSEELYRKGIDLYEQRRDKAWSLTDCISFIVMQEHDIIEALTADKHFEQAGFVPLLL